jgi:hypothetical protein
MPVRTHGAAELSRLASNEKRRTYPKWRICSTALTTGQVICASACRRNPPAPPDHSIARTNSKPCPRRLSSYNLLSDCASFGLNLEEAQQVIDKMAEVVKGWRELFLKHKVEERSIEHISGAILPECFFRLSN